MWGLKLKCHISQGKFHINWANVQRLSLNFIDVYLEIIINDIVVTQTPSLDSTTELNIFQTRKQIYGKGRNGTPVYLQSKLSIQIYIITTSYCCRLRP